MRQLFRRKQKHIVMNSLLNSDDNLIDIWPKINFLSCCFK